MAQLDPISTAQLSTAVYNMVQEVVAAGAASVAYQSTRELQRLWNSKQVELKSAGVAWFKLTEDGLYGSNTGKALAILTGTTTPTKTAGIPGWYSANKSLIDSYAPRTEISTTFPTSEDLDVIDQLHGAVYLMAQEVASSGGAATTYPSVLRLQRIWNQNKAVINRAYAAGVVPTAWFKLTEDSLYGPNTGTVLSYVTSTSTPAKTYGLVAWYAANRDLIDSYALAAERFVSGSANLVIANAKAEPSPAEVLQAAEAVAQSASSGSLTREAAPDQTATSTPQGQLVTVQNFATETEDVWGSNVAGDTITSSVAKQGTVVSQTSVTPPNALESKLAVVNEIARIAPSINSVDFAEEPVIAARTKSNTAVFALGIGVVAALGTFAYMASRKTRRRAA